MVRKKKDFHKEKNHFVFHLIRQEGGYFHLQATKPDTIGYALNDSPLGLGLFFFDIRHFDIYIYLF